MQQFCKWMTILFLHHMTSHDNSFVATGYVPLCPCTHLHIALGMIIVTKANYQQTPSYACFIQPCKGQCRGDLNVSAAFQWISGICNPFKKWEGIMFFILTTLHFLHRNGQHSILAREGVVGSVVTRKSIPSSNAYFKHLLLGSVFHVCHKTTYKAFLTTYTPNK